MAEPNLARHRRGHRLGNLHHRRDGDRRPEVSSLVDSECSAPGIPHSPLGVVWTTWRGTGDRPILYPGRYRLWIRIGLLCRACRYDSYCRQRVHLHLRYDGRTHRLDYRLGLDSGIRREQHGRQRWVFAALGQLVGLVRRASESSLDFARLPPQWTRRPRRQRALWARVAFRLQLAGVHNCDAPDGHPSSWYPRVGGDQQRDGDDEDHCHSCVCFVRLALHPYVQLASLRSQRLAWHSDGRIDRIFHLHRFRFGFYGGGRMQEPQRDLPIGIIATLVVCTLLYISVVVVLTGLVRWDTLVDDAAPVVNTLKKLHISSVRLVVLIGALMGMISSLLVFQIGQARVWFAMSRYC